MSGRRWRWGSVFALCALLVAGGVTGQEEEEAEKKKKPWSNKTEFGFTSTSGNAEATNLSLGNNFKYNWYSTRNRFITRYTKILPNKSYKIW